MTGWAVKNTGVISRRIPCRFESTKVPIQVGSFSLRSSSVLIASCRAKSNSLSSVQARLGSAVEKESALTKDESLGCVPDMRLI